MSKTFDIFSYQHINLNSFTLYSSKQILPKVTNNIKVVDNSINDVNTIDYGVCKVCGRKLKDVESCHMGMGPICFYKYKQTLYKCRHLF